MIRIALNVLAMVAMITAVVVLSVVSVSAVEPEPDPVPNAITSEWLMFGDGRITTWFNEWKEDRAAARKERAEIRAEIAALNKLFDGSILGGIKDVITSLTYLVVALIILVVFAQILPIIRGVFSKTAVLIICCILPSVALADDPEPNIPVPNMVMFAGENCPPCERWKVEVLPKLLPQGWNVLIVKGVEPPYPKFLIKRGEKWIPHVGTLSIDRLRQIVEGK